MALAQVVYQISTDKDFASRMQSDPQSALDRPRFCLEGGQPDAQVALEKGMPRSTIKKLAAMGHEVVSVAGFDRAVFGRGHIIVQDRSSGVLWGGSDPRGDGCAMSF